MTEKLNSKRLVTEYVVSIRNRGAFLSYADHQIIDEWLQTCPDVDSLLLTLDDILPEIFSRKSGDRHPPGLKYARKAVENALGEGCYQTK